MLGGMSLAREKAVLLFGRGHRLLVGVAPGRQTLLMLDRNKPPFEDTLSARPPVAMAVMQCRETSA